MRRWGVATLVVCQRGSSKRADKVLSSSGKNIVRDEGEGTEVFKTRAVFSLFLY